MLILGFIVIIITIIGIEAQLRKGNKQNEKIIELLKEINEKE